MSAGADMVTVSVESARHIHRALQRLAEMENANDPARGKCVSSVKWAFAKIGHN